MEARMNKVFSETEQAYATFSEWKNKRDCFLRTIDDEITNGHPHPNASVIGRLYYLIQENDLDLFHHQRACCALELRFDNLQESVSFHFSGTRQRVDMKTSTEVPHHFRMQIAKIKVMLGMVLSPSWLCESGLSVSMLSWQQPLPLVPSSSSSSSTSAATTSTLPDDDETDANDNDDDDVSVEAIDLFFDK